MPLDILRLLQTSFGMQKLTYSLWLSSLCNLAVEHEVVTCYNFFPQYLAWRVMVGLNQSVTISFLLVGHTKFAPDWCFGLFKLRFRRTFVSSLQEIADVVESSADVNVAQLVGTQDGRMVVPVYDWSQFLGEHFERCRR